MFLVGFPHPANISSFPSSVVWEDNYNFFRKASFTEIHEETDAGSIYTSTLEAIYPKYDQDISDKINALLAYKYIIKVQNANGDEILMGHPTRPVKITCNTKFGEKPSDLNHAKIIITHKSPYPAPFL